MSNLVKYTNTKLKKIVNVYQLQYKNGPAQGFGDFLTGSLFLFQLCVKHSLIFDMDFTNHPLSKNFIIEKKDNNIDYTNVLYYTDLENFRRDKILLYNTFISHLNKINDEVYYLFCNFNPLYHIQNQGPVFIKSKLILNLEIENNIKKILDNFNLMPYNFDIIHIRSGDKYLLSNNKLNNITVQKYIQLFTNIVDINKKYIILSDNLTLKKAIKKINKFNNFFIDDLSEICHTGENSIKTESQLKNTVTDFFLMSKSQNITSVSLMSRGGTGFSRSCAMIFKIPYRSILINLGSHF